MDTLRSGTSLDVAGVPLNDIRQMPALEAEGYSVAQVPNPGVAEILPNLYNPTAGPLLRQLYVRQAMEYLINRKQIVSKVFAGYADPGNGPVPVLYGKQWDSPLEKAGRPVPVLAVEGDRAAEGARLEGRARRHRHLPDAPAPAHRTAAPASRRARR